MVNRFALADVARNLFGAIPAVMGALEAPVAGAVSADSLGSVVQR